jgi:aminopeptidase
MGPAVRHYLQDFITCACLPSGDTLEVRMSTPTLEITALSHEQKLDRLAEVAIRVGLGLAPGQELVMTATLDTLPLVRRITEQAYRAGGSLVTTLLADEESQLLRYKYGSNESFDYAPSWLYEGMANAFRTGAARLAVAGGNPSLLSQEDPEKVGRANRAVSKAYRPALELITRHDINWTIVAAATPAWAATVFPDLPADEALTRLWDAIFAASRVDTPDPVGPRRRPTPPRRSAESEALLRPSFPSPRPRNRHRPPRRTRR